MTPSKRAGDTVDESVDDRQGRASRVRHGASHASNGDGAVNGSSRRPSPRRRSVITAATAVKPARGTRSKRGISSSSISRPSSSITKGTAQRFGGDRRRRRQDAEVTAKVPVTPPPPPPSAPEPSSAAASAPAETAAPQSGEGASLAPPVSPPAARVDPDARRPVPGPDTAVMPLPLPVTTPTEQSPAERETELPRQEEPAPEGPPYVAPTVTAHDVAPVPRLLGRRPRVRRVTRVVRHVDPWSVFKVGIVFNLVLYGVLLTSGVLLWNVAYATGTVDNLERFFESFGWEEFEFNGGEIYHAAWIAGLFGVVGLTGAMVLAATLFNLITDLVGGVRMTVLEEEVVERTSAPIRRFVVRRPTSSGDPSAGLRREVDRLPARQDDDDPE